MHTYRSRRDILTAPHEHNLEDVVSSLEHPPYTITLIYRFSFDGCEDDKHILYDELMLESDQTHYREWRQKNADILNNPKGCASGKRKSSEDFFIRSCLARFLKEYFCLPYVKVDYYEFNY